MAGFVKSNMDIKLMVLYALSKFHEPPTLEELSQVMLCDEGVNYFLLTQSLDELLLPQNIFLKRERYGLTRRGKDNLKECLPQLSLALQTRVDEALVLVNGKEDQEKFLKTEITEREDGSVLLHMSLSDETGLLFDSTMMIPTREQAEIIAESYRNEAVTYFYTLREKLFDISSVSM